MPKSRNNRTRFSECLEQVFAGPKGPPNVIPDRKPRGRPKKEPAVPFTKTSAVISIEDTLNTTSTAPSNIITEGSPCGSPCGSPIVPAFTIAESSPIADPKTLSLNSPFTLAAGAHDILSAPVTKAAEPVSKVMKSLETKIIEPVENIPLKPISQAKTSIASSSPKESNINLTYKCEARPSHSQIPISDKIEDNTLKLIPAEVQEVVVDRSIQCLSPCENIQQESTQSKRKRITSSGNEDDRALKIDKKSPPYFTRSKRKRSDSSADDDNQIHKIARAMIAAYIYEDKVISLVKLRFPLLRKELSKFQDRILMQLTTNEPIKAELIKWGLKQSRIKPCKFVNNTTGVILLVYVDDTAAAARSKIQLQEFFEILSARFKTKNLGEIEKILGARVTRDRTNQTLYIDQEQYLSVVLDKFGITTGKHKAKKIPVTDYESLRPATAEDERIHLAECQQAIGSLLYAMIYTRPDIAFVVGKLSQFMSDPAKHHGPALKNLLRYLRSTMKQKLRFGPGRAREYLTIYSDADWANDKSDRKSIFGSVAMFYGGPISWSSKKQRAVSTSSCESEYVALSACAKNGQWLAQLLRDVGRENYIGPDRKTVQMLGDNMGAIALTKNPHLNERSKHIDICHHYVRGLAKSGRLQVSYVPTSDMVADGMTKPLQRVCFEKCKDQLGIVQS
ncbi:hypothetical protein K3495_g3040 [Podosphaera aphanis]|nr:hypothetical protein K3495_g3040 [Podosphaera aphanis]